MAQHKFLANRKDELPLEESMYRPSSPPSEVGGPLVGGVATGGEVCRLVGRYSDVVRVGAVGLTSATEKEKKMYVLIGDQRILYRCRISFCKGAAADEHIS